MMKPRYYIEAGLLWLFLRLFRLLPLDVASAAGARIGRTIGPMLPQSRTALRNIARAFPQSSEAERKKILLGMWDNLGRVMAEFPHYPGGKLFDRVTYEGAEHMPQHGTAALFMSGHMGNWELLYSIAANYNLPVTLVYRHANNPLTERMITGIRKTHSANMLPKGPQGAVRLARTLKEGESIALLVDQKMNEGIAVPFFGHPAMTAPAIAKLALRFSLPIIPTRIIRTEGANFRGVTYPALHIEQSGDAEADVLRIMMVINQLLESWIRECPEQWFWVHRRWPEN